MSEQAKHIPGQVAVYRLARVIKENSRLLEGEAHALATALLKAGYDDCASELLAALGELTLRAGTISPLAGKTGVKGVREAGKLMAALDKARATLAKASAV